MLSGPGFGHLPIDTDKAKRALDHLQAERQAQNDRLQLAAQAKHKLDANIALRTVLLSEVEVQSLYKR